MWQRFTLYDARVIAFYLGVLVLFSSAAMLVPLAVALAFQEWSAASHYLFAIGVSLVLGSGLRFLRIEPGKLNQQQAMAVTGFAWFTLALIGAVPLYLSGHFGSYLDALFDAVAGWTTSNASTMVDLDHLSYADNAWRIAMSFFGGLGLLVVSLSLGIVGGLSASSLYASEGRSEHVLPNVVHTARFIVRFSVGTIALFGIVLAIICCIDGFDPAHGLFHGFSLAVSAFMTAGCSLMSSSVVYYHSPAIEGLLILLMLVGSINFALFAEVGKGRIGSFFKDTEVRTAVIWLLAITAVFTAAMCAGGTFASFPELLRRGLFMIVSSATTTGFLDVTGNQFVTAFTSGSFLVLAILAAVGGCAGSTAGGIKISRIGIIAKAIMSMVKEFASPDTACVTTTYYHIGRRILDSGAVKNAMAIFILYVVSFAVGALVAIAYGYDAQAAIFESVAMTSCTGMTAGITGPDMPAAVEMVFMLQMWAGRLEFVTLIALFVKVFVSVKPRKITGVGA